MAKSNHPILQHPAAIGLPFSNEKGFRPQDYDTRCSVVEGRICPEKLALISQYTLNAVRDDDGIPDVAIQDSNILTIKLREYPFWAKEDECSEADKISCPTRERMNESTVRKTGVSTARKIMSLLGIRNH